MTKPPDGLTAAMFPSPDDIGRRTPRLLYDFDGLERRLREVAERAESAALTLAYSIKTNPSQEILRRVHEAGLAAEAISGAEVDAAHKAGFDASRIVLGGVAKAWPRGPVHDGLLAIVDDTLEGFEHGVRTSSNRHHCVRLRIPDVGSRLGFDTTDAVQAQRLARTLRDARRNGTSVGLATHDRYIALSRLNEWFAAIQRLLESLDGVDPGVLVTIDCLNLGGGYDAHCLDRILSGDVSRVILGYLRNRLPNCRTLILEPGRSLVQAYGAVAASVIARQSEVEVSVDASVAELPWPMRTRPVFAWRTGGWHQLPPGDGVIAGRTTAETDLLARSVDVSGCHEGDMLLFGEAGAYDVSMRSAFGMGYVVETQ